MKMYIFECVITECSIVIPGNNEKEAIITLKLLVKDSDIWKLSSVE